MYIEGRLYDEIVKKHSTYYTEVHLVYIRIIKILFPSNILNLYQLSYQFMLPFS